LSQVKKGLWGFPTDSFQEFTLVNLKLFQNVGEQVGLMVLAG